MPRLLLAWLLTTLAICTGFRGAKAYVREHMLALDETLRESGTGSSPRAGGMESGARVVWTWFCPFRTAAAAAPSLLFWSFALAIWASGTQNSPLYFFLPGLCFASSMAISFVSKRVFKRARPARKVGAFGHKMRDASFPSGHSLTAFCFWFTLAFAVFLATGSAFLALLVGVFALLIVLFTGLSRVYLGVHFPSDVFGGYFMGLVWCFVCYFALAPIL